MFRDLYQVIIGVAIEAELKEDAVTGTKEVLALTFFEDGTNEVMHKVRYLPIEGDAAHYAVEENGLCLQIAAFLIKLLSVHRKIIGGCSGTIFIFLLFMPQVFLPRRRR